MTIETITSTFEYMDGDDSGCYCATVRDSEYGNSCEVYILTKDKIITQSQVDEFNSFRLNYKKYIPEIEQYIKNSLTPSELKKADEIYKAALYLDEIEIPQGNPNYDLVLICVKSYKKFLLINTNIQIRVEFQKGKVKSILRTDNE